MIIFLRSGIQLKQLMAVNRFQYEADYLHSCCWLQVDHCHNFSMVLLQYFRIVDSLDGSIIKIFLNWFVKLTQIIY